MAKVGRPSKYDKAYCDDAIAVLGQGKSILSLAAHIGVSRSTIYGWMDQYPEFLNAVKAGQAKAAAWWEQRAIDLASAGNSNATTIIFALKNRAKDEWSDTTKHEHSGQVQIDQITAGRNRATERPE